MNSANNGLILMRTCDGQNARVGSADSIGLNPVATRYDHPAVLLHRFTNSRKAFSLGTVKKASGIDQHHVSVVITGCNQITLGSKLGQNAL